MYRTPRWAGIRIPCSCPPREEHRILLYYRAGAGVVFSPEDRNGTVTACRRYARTSCAGASLGNKGKAGNIMENEIKVSVIMPIYNAYDYLSPALDSVLYQTLRDIEIICVDDGSTDHSLDIIKKYQKEDDRIRIVTENNAGPSVARNNGIRRARGEYLAFLDADDFFEPTLLETMYNAAVRWQLDVTVSDYDLYQNKLARFTRSIPSERADALIPGEVTSRSDIPEAIFQCTDGYVWNKLFRRGFLEEKGLLFPTEARIFEDSYFVATALAQAERIGRTEGIHLHHRVYSEQGRSRLFRKYYHQVPGIYADLRDFLMHNGMYLPLEKSYLNLVASRCFKLYNLLWIDAKIAYWNLLHEKYADALGWTESTPALITDREVSEFVANTEMFTYAQYLKREARGIKIKLADFARSRRGALKRKKFRDFFTNIFRKKDKGPKA